VDLILNIGDQVDVGTLNHWRNLHFEYGKLITPNIPSMTTVGNHETYSGDSNLTLYKSLFHYEQLTYQGIVSLVHRPYQAEQPLAVIRFEMDAGDFRIDWDSKPTKKYDLEVSTDMVTWTALKRDWKAISTSSTLYASPTPGTPGEFYRLREK